MTPDSTMIEQGYRDMIEKLKEIEPASSRKRRPVSFWLWLLGFGEAGDYAKR